MFTPRYHISPLLLERIKRITILVYELNQHHLPTVVLNNMQTEAAANATYASTTIEGNPLPLTEVKRLLKNEPSQIRNSEREVLNYNRALTALHQQRPKTVNEISLTAIHKTVMEGLLPAHQLGKWRQHPIIVNDLRSREAVYLPPDVQDVPALMADLFDFVAQEQDRLDPLLVAGIFHKQFVLIHPFMDGNGRTARLATNLLLAGLGLNFFSLLNFEAYYNHNVTRYFYYVGERGDYYESADQLEFTAWLEYFTDGILDALLHLQDQLSRQHATPETRLQPYHQIILDYIAAHSFITDREYAQLTERAKATRTLDFRKLIELGLIERHGRGRAIYYKLVNEKWEKS